MGTVHPRLSVLGQLGAHKFRVWMAKAEHELTDDGGPETVEPYVDSVALAEQRQRVPAIEGFIDAVTDDQIIGWAWCPADPSARLRIEVILDGQPIGTTVADRQREDLRRVGIGDGEHSFAFQLPEAAGVEIEQLIEVRAGAARLPLEVARGYSSQRRLQVARFAAATTAVSPAPEAALLTEAGWLFPLYGAGTAAVSEGEVALLVQRHEHISGALAELNVPYLLAIAPLKRDVYPKRVPQVQSPHGVLVRRMASDLRDSPWPEPLDLVLPLRDAHRHGAVYPRTDSRVNARGGFFAVRAMIKELAKSVSDVVPLGLNRARGVRLDGFLGDLVELPRVDQEGEPTDREVLAESTLEVDASALMSVQMPAPAQLSLAGHAPPRLFELADEPQLPRLAMMGDAVVDQVLPWFAEHSRRTVVFRGHEPSLELVELEAPDAIVHVVTAVELLSLVRHPGEGPSSPEHHESAAVG